MGAGSWTSRLAKLVAKDASQLGVVMDGPYGDLSIDLCNYRCVTMIVGKLLLIYICNSHVLRHLLLIYICKLHWNTMIAGGIGITPMLPILDTIRSSGAAGFPNLERVDLIWSVR
jgi:hypothetical protein